MYRGDRFRILERRAPESFSPALRAFATLIPPIANRTPVGPITSYGLPQQRCPFGVPFPSAQIRQSDPFIPSASSNRSNSPLHNNYTRFVYVRI